MKCRPFYLGIFVADDNPLSINFLPTDLRNRIAYEFHGRLTTQEIDLVMNGVNDGRGSSRCDLWKIRTQGLQQAKSEEEITSDQILYNLGFDFATLGTFDFTQLPRQGINPFRKYVKLCI